MDQDVFTVSMTGETVVDSAEFNILVSINSEIVANPIN